LRGQFVTATATAPDSDAAEDVAGVGSHRNAAPKVGEAGEDGKESDATGCNGDQDISPGVGAGDSDSSDLEVGVGNDDDGGCDDGEIGLQ
jgi:hypothetical protein